MYMNGEDRKLTSARGRSLRGAIFLVGVVAAVVFEVAAPFRRDTSTVITLELIGQARTIIYKSIHKKKTKKKTGINQELVSINSLH